MFSKRFDTNNIKFQVKKPVTYIMSYLYIHIASKAYQIA